MTLFPNDQHYGEVQARHPLPQLDLVEKRALDQFTTGTLPPFAGLTIQEWWIHLSNRMIHARQAYHLMLYYFELGIPDDRPFISPGRDGASVEYFPDFTDDDFSKKAWFDFYSDVFGYKLLSAWDSIGQLFAEVQAITVKRPAFHSVALALKEHGVEVGEQFLSLWDRNDFKHFREMRDAATHRFLPGTFGGSNVRDEKPGKIDLSDGRRVLSLASFSMGVGRYARGRDRVSIANGALVAFNDTLKASGLRVPQ